MRRMLKIRKRSQPARAERVRQRLYRMACRQLLARLHAPSPRYQPYQDIVRNTLK